MYFYVIHLTVLSGFFFFWTGETNKAIRTLWYIKLNKLLWLQLINKQQYIS